jgi:hypothetical protein
MQRQQNERYVPDHETLRAKLDLRTVTQKIAGFGLIKAFP